MSDTGSLPDPSEPPPIPPSAPPPRRDGCLTALMVVAGLILLLPGLCVLMLSSSLPNTHFEDIFNPFVLICLLIGLGGITLIWLAIRGPRS